MLDLILIYLLVRGAAEAWKETKAAWGRSRSAYTASAARRYPGMSPRRRAAHAARHDLGYGLSQLLHGFPQARHGFAQGWHEGRQAHVQARTAQERARTEHAETRAGALAERRELRERRREAQEEIRRQRQGEAPEGTPEGTSPEVDEHDEPAPATYCGYCGTRGGEQCPPRCATWTRDNPYPGREGGPAYSYGYEGSTAGWPAATSEQAHHQAEYMSGDGDPWVVTEYPPGGGPGTTVAVYRNGEVVPPAAIGNALAGVASETPVRCMQHPGRACRWVQYADGTGEHVTGPEQEVPREGSSPTEGTTSMSDVTYQSVSHDLRAAIGEAETRASDARTATAAAEMRAQELTSAKTYASTISDAMQALKVDPATLGAMADHHDALDAAEKAYQQAQEALEAARQSSLRVQETAEQSLAALMQHAHFQQAHDDSHVEAADREFYAS